MVTQEQAQPQAELEISGSVIATGVSLEDYLARYAEQHCEWVEGVVIQMAAGTLKHNGLVYYLYRLLDIYFTLKPIGQVIGQPFVLRLPEFPNRRREPDLIVRLDINPNELKNTYMDGAPDVCIEIVSEESTARDYGDKFAEYEAGGVPEYWIIDSLRQETHFYRLNDEKRYIRHTEDEAGNYRSPTLPGLALHIATLWEDQLPDPISTVDAVKAMLGA
ncbi:MAG: Uma2 family endonuclease [Anaerolineae bacterium]|nr:Uma2 family endonuclease [Anaerolineae bacterium]